MAKVHLPSPAQLLRLYSIGEQPTAFMKAAAKADTEPKPQERATSATLPPRSRRDTARSMRLRVT